MLPYLAEATLRNAFGVAIQSRDPRQGRHSIVGT
jgi:hypothetical protein